MSQDVNVYGWTKNVHTCFQYASLNTLFQGTKSFSKYKKKFENAKQVCCDYVSHGQVTNERRPQPQGSHQPPMAALTPGGGEDPCSRWGQTKGAGADRGCPWTNPGVGSRKTRGYPSRRVRQRGECIIGRAQAGLGTFVLLQPKEQPACHDGWARGGGGLC